jgi:hypothetical protein
MASKQELQVQQKRERPALDAQPSQKNGLAAGDGMYISVASQNDRPAATIRMLG